MSPGYLACGGWVANAVSAAARLGFADLLANHPCNAAELGAATGTREQIVAKLMDLLVEVKLFARNAEGSYINTDDSCLLSDSHPQSMRHFCILAGEVYQRGFGELIHTLKTGESGLERAFDMSLLDLMKQQPEVGTTYDRAMAELTRPVGAALAGARDYSGVRLIVDIGGGRGALLCGLLRQLPNAVAGMVYDLPAVCERAAAALPVESPDLVGRLNFRSGDFFATIPHSADLYLLKNVLHNWNDAHCIALLTKVKEALQDHPEQRLLIIEPVLDGHMPSLYKALDNLMQCVISETGSTGRTEAQLGALAEAAGLHLTGSVRLSSGQLVIEAKG